MSSIYERTSWLIGDENLDKLKKSKILIFGVGGVGGYCAEALCRAGIGEITIVDYDIIDITNLNRQIIATRDNIGLEKVTVMKKRLYSINEEIIVTPIPIRIEKENIDQFELEKYDYIIDAIDDVSGKISIIESAHILGIPVISSMGTGNKIMGEKLKISDISKTNTCPLARVMRKELGKIGIKHLKVVFSDEEPRRVKYPSNGGLSPASISFIPPIAGLLIAGEVIRDIIGISKWGV